MNSERLEKFFAVAREREAIRQRRDDGLPPPWTADKILARNHFCNVHRANDRTTRAIVTAMIRQKSVEGWYATAILGRFANSAELMMRLAAMPGRGWRDLADEDLLKQVSSVKARVGAYKIHTPRGLWNRQGIVDLVRREQNRATQVCVALDSASGCRQAHEIVSNKPCLVGFQAYQVVLDLQSAGYFNRPDYRPSDWVYIGPGAVRGARWLLGQDVDTSHTSKDFNVFDKAARELGEEVCYRLVDLAEASPELWPTQLSPLTVHDMEFWLCEMDKYRRIQSTGRGRLFHPTAG